MTTTKSTKTINPFPNHRVDDPNVLELKRLEKQYSAALETFKQSSAMWQTANSLAETLERQKDKHNKNLQETHAKIQSICGMLFNEERARKIN